MENADKSKAKLCETYYKVLGVRVDTVQIPEVVAPMKERIARREAGHYMAVTGMHGGAGLLFERENSADLAAKVGWAWNPPEQLAPRSRAARAASPAKGEPARNYAIWMRWYGRVARG